MSKTGSPKLRRVEHGGTMVRMDFPAELQRVLELLVRLMVGKPDDVRVVRVDGLGVNLQVQVHPYDLGKVVGKQGRTARSIRTILLVMAQGAGTTAHVDFVEKGESTSGSS